MSLNVCYIIDDCGGFHPAVGYIQVVFAYVDGQVRVFESESMDLMKEAPVALPIDALLK